MGMMEIFPPNFIFNIFYLIIFNFFNFILTAFFFVILISGWLMHQDLSFTTLDMTPLQQ